MFRKLYNELIARNRDARETIIRIRYKEGYISITINNLRYDITSLYIIEFWQLLVIQQLHQIRHRYSAYDGSIRARRRRMPVKTKCGFNSLRHTHEKIVRSNVTSFGNETRSNTAV